MSTRLSGRLTRLLNLVPYFLAHPGISAAEAARDLGVTPKQIMDDLNQLWVCGLPGYGPGDLIDLSFSEDSIVVTFTAGIDRPLRLTSTEATALLVAHGMGFFKEEGLVAEKPTLIRSWSSMWSSRPTARRTGASPGPAGKVSAPAASWRSDQLLDPE